MWGWLYILQQAQNGDSIGAFTSYASLTGRFQRSQDGHIDILGNVFSIFDGKPSHSLNGTPMKELGFALFAASDADGYYVLQGVTGGYATTWGMEHEYLSIDSGTLTVTALKAGTGFGPMMVEAAPVTGPAAPVVATAGVIYTGVGWATTLTVDLVVPILEHDWQTPAVAGATEAFSQILDRYGGSLGEQIAPFVGPGVDLMQGACFGTGC
jgi:hypothetical protein